MAHPSVGSDGHYVLLNLGSRTSGDTLLNRIALKADNIAISTTKNVLSMPVPFAGLVGGASENVALDFGVATKNISISGIITNQNIVKSFDDEDVLQEDSTLTPRISSGTTTVNMTAHEVSQLIHSYVDSSFRQEQQNFVGMVILIPSKVDENYQYHTTDIVEATESDDENIKLIPFTYLVRDGGSKFFDAKSFTDTQRGTWPPPITDGGEITPMSGFVRSFNSTFVGGQPFVEFSLEFEIARNPLG